MKFPAKISDNFYYALWLYLWYVALYRFVLWYAGYGAVQDAGSIVLYLIWIYLFLVAIREYWRRFKVRWGWLPHRWQNFKQDPRSFLTSSEADQLFRLCSEFLFWFFCSSCYIFFYSPLLTDIQAILDSIVNNSPIPFGFGQVRRILLWTLVHKYNLEYLYKIKHVLYLSGRDGYDPKYYRDLKGGIHLRKCLDKFYKLSWSSFWMAIFLLFVYWYTGVGSIQNGWTLLFLVSWIWLLDELVREMFWRQNR